MHRLRALAANLDLYVVMALSVVLALLAVLGVYDGRIIAAAMLLTLTLISYALLHNRRLLEELLPHLQVLARSVGPPRASEIMRSLDAQGSLDQYFDGCNDVFMAGITLFTRANMLHMSYKKMLDDGCNFRVVVLDRKSPILGRIATAQRTTKAALQDQLDAAVSLFRVLQDYSQQPTVPGTFQLVVFDYAPSLTLMRTRNTRTGQISIHVELQAYGSGIWQRPVVRVTPQDEKLFDYFESVCQSLWNDAVGTPHP